MKNCVSYLCKRNKENNNSRKRATSYQSSADVVQESQQPCVKNLEFAKLTEYSKDSSPSHHGMINLKGCTPSNYKLKFKNKLNNLPMYRKCIKEKDGRSLARNKLKVFYVNKKKPTKPKTRYIEHLRKFSEAYDISCTMKIRRNRSGYSRRSCSLPDNCLSTNTLHPSDCLRQNKELMSPTSASTPTRNRTGTCITQNYMKFDDGGPRLCFQSNGPRMEKRLEWYMHKIKQLEGNRQRIQIDLNNSTL